MRSTASMAIKHTTIADHMPSSQSASLHGWNFEIVRLAYCIRTSIRGQTTPDFVADANLDLKGSQPPVGHQRPSPLETQEAEKDGATPSQDSMATKVYQRGFASDRQISKMI
jgi:hypothetical protein